MERIAPESLSRLKTKKKQKQRHPNSSLAALFQHTYLCMASAPLLLPPCIAAALLLRCDRDASPLSCSAAAATDCMRAAANRAVAEPAVVMPAVAMPACACWVCCCACLRAAMLRALTTLATQSAAQRQQQRMPKQSAAGAEAIHRYVC